MLLRSFLAAKISLTNGRIKKAYRRKALEHHPDRNYGNVETATSQFAEIQSAYEILSDPHERAWYDSHRDAILRDDQSAEAGEYENNVRLTSVEDIVRIFRKFGGSTQCSDASSGFFSVLRETFDSLAREEDLICQWEDLDPIPWPSFGAQHDDYETIVRHFYVKWTGFATQKTFSWKEKYKSSDAPDRRIRRLMEKENKRLREEAIREFNDAVRSLVAFVKKRDPRVKLYSESEADRQRILRAAAAAQAARSRAANHLKSAQFDTLPDWTKSSEPADSSDEVCQSAPKEEIECIVCNKAFKSEKQFEAHEKSKKHIRNVGQIRKEMRRDDDQLDLAEDATGAKPSNEDQRLHHSDEKRSLESSPNYFVEVSSMDDNLDIDSARSVDSVSPSNATDESSRPQALQRATDGQPPLQDSREALAGLQASQSLPAPLQDTDAFEDRGSNVEAGTTDHIKGPKFGKAKQKRAKKAAQNSSEASVGSAMDVKCNTCGSEFASKTRLFHHLDESGHAQPIVEPRRKGKGIKKK